MFFFSVLFVLVAVVVSNSFSPINLLNFDRFFSDSSFEIVDTLQSIFVFMDYFVPVFAVFGSGSSFEILRTNESTASIRNTSCV